MKCVRVNIKKVELDSFSLKEGAELSIFFDDGANKCLKYSSMLKNPNEDVKNIITKLNVYEKAQNKVLDANDILDSFVSVVIENEESTQERIFNFLKQIGDGQQKLANFGTHKGYLTSLNKMQKKTLVLKAETK